MFQSRFAIGSYSIEKGDTSDKIEIESIRELWDSFSKFVASLIFAFVLWSIGSQMIVISQGHVYGSAPLSTLITSIIMGGLAIQFSFALSELRDMAESASGLVASDKNQRIFESNLKKYNVLFRITIIGAFFIIVSSFILAQTKGNFNSLTTWALGLFALITLFHTFIPENNKKYIHSIFYSPFDKIKIKFLLMLLGIFLLGGIITMTLFAKTLNKKIIPLSEIPLDQTRLISCNQLPLFVCENNMSSQEIIGFTLIFAFIIIVSNFLLNRILTHLANNIREISQQSQEYILVEKMSEKDSDEASSCALSHFLALSALYENTEDETEIAPFFACYEILALLLYGGRTDNDLAQMVWKDSEKSELAKSTVVSMLGPLNIIEEKEGAFHLIPSERRRAKAWLLKNNMINQIKELEASLSSELKKED